MMEKSYRPFAALLLCNVIWALDYPFYKIVLPDFVAPTAMLVSAVWVAALFSLVTLLWSPWEKVEKRDIPKLLGAAVLIAVLRKLFLMEGIARTSPVDGSVINTMGPIFVLLLSVLMGMDRLTPRRLSGLVFGVCGALAVILMGSSPSHGSSSLSGNLLVMLCALSTAFYMVWFKKMIVKYKTVTIMRWMYCAGALLLLPFGAKEVVEIDYSAFTHPVLWAYLFILFVPTFVPNLLQAYGLKYVAPMVSSMFAYIGPVVATAVSVGMGQDRLHWDTMLGAAAIFFGLYLVITSYRKKAARVDLEGVGGN